jgi:dephospho-CoA kinase
VTVTIGLSGGIGTGKSSVVRMFADLGAVVVDADAIVHELQARGQPLVAEIAEAFGPGVLDAQGGLDRAALGAIVFRDPAARTRLNDLVHPKVGAEFARRIAAARASGAGVLVRVNPPGFEGRSRGPGWGARMEFDATVLVYAPEALQIERQLSRDGCARDEAVRRVRAQMPIEEKKALADYVIDNSGTLEETSRQVREVFSRNLAAAPSAPR